MSDERRRILLGVDGSECSIDATRYVASFFRPRKTEVVLFHVREEVPEVFLDRGKEAGLSTRDLPMDDWARETKRRLESSLEKGREILSAAGFPRKAVTAKIQSKESGIARDLLKEAREGYDVVVVGRYGLSQAKGVVLGSVAHKLATKMHPVPIAIVGGTPGTAHVLIGFDGSEGSKRAVNCACSVVPAGDREVTLCFVVRSLGAHLGDLSVFGSEHEKRWLQASRQEMEFSLEEAENRLITAGFHPSRVFVRQVENQTSRAEGILAATQNGPCGTVLVGRRGHTSIEEFPMGRVPWKLLQMASDLAVWVV